MYMLRRCDEHIVTAFNPLYQSDRISVQRRSSAMQFWHLPSPPFAFLCEPDATLRKDDRP
jgi:hypothetical protein